MSGYRTAVGGPDGSESSLRVGALAGVCGATRRRERDLLVVHTTG